jgi:hypothetical protein
VIRLIWAWLDADRDHYVSESTRRHYVLQQALADLEPPEPEPWLEPHPDVRPVRKG